MEDLLSSMEKVDVREKQAHAQKADIAITSSSNCHPIPTLTQDHTTTPKLLTITSPPTSSKANQPTSPTSDTEDKAKPPLPLTHQNSPNNTQSQPRPQNTHPTNITPRSPQSETLTLNPHYKDHQLLPLTPIPDLITMLSSNTNTPNTKHEGNMWGEKIKSQCRKWKRRAREEKDEKSDKP